VRLHYGLEGLEFAYGAWLVNGVDADLREEVGDAEGFDFALLQAAKA
jgi:hypothetical protein